MHGLTSTNIRVTHLPIKSTPLLQKQSLTGSFLRCILIWCFHLKHHLHFETTKDSFLHERSAAGSWAHWLPLIYIARSRRTCFRGCQTLWLSCGGCLRSRQLYSSTPGLSDLSNTSRTMDGKKSHSVLMLGFLACNCACWAGWLQIRGRERSSPRSTRCPA